MTQEEIANGGDGIVAALTFPELEVLATRREMRDLVQASLARWEPRILLDSVEAWEVPEDPSQVRVEIGYRLARTGAAGAMNVTVDLES